MPYPADERLQNIANRMKAERDSGAMPVAEPTTVRELLGWFNYARRSDRLIRRIRTKFAELNLRTVPDFEREHIDGDISIELDMEATGVRKESVDPTVRIRVLPTARCTLTSVQPNNPLAKATTNMLIEDFSQLPVMVNEREVKGVVSWRSIGTAFTLGCQSDEVRHWMERHREIAINAPLFDAIKDIWEHGYVLVRDVDRTISGIVTASDFARQFAQLAQPFLIIGEIELHLRNLVSKFTLEEMAEASDDPSTSIEGSWDLNFGTYCRLLENPDRWDRLGLRVDRATFMHNLGQVREMRNEVMHFAPDGLDPNEVEKLERVAMFLRMLT